MSWNGRNSLQNENSFLRRKSYDQAQRLTSVDCRGRSSGGQSSAKPRASSEERRSSNLWNVGGQSSVKPRASSEERKSNNICWNGPRRSSIINEAKMLLKDPRPLNDKAYQKRKVDELIKYLQETGCQFPVTASKLMQPSKKDFETIFQHFINFWDSQYVVKRIEEEAPKILKDLCYPFIPNKSAFLYVARTNWPPLLGILLFLLEVSKYADSFDPKLLLSTGEEEHSVLLEFIFNFYFSKNEDEAEVRKMFIKLIKDTQIPHDIDELAQMNEEIKNRLEDVQSEVDKIDYLKNLSEQQGNDLKKYEDYFLKMKDLKRKKMEVCQNLSEDCAVKEAELLDLNATRDKKQEAYDAQGFDGKKQVSYYEEQKKELLEKLQAKKAALKNIQQKCWDVEMQYSQTLDKGTSASESFNEMYSSVSQASDKVLDILKDIQGPQVRSVCSSLNVIFPDCKMQPMQNVFSQGPSARTKLEEIKNKIDSVNAIFKSLLSQQSQILNESEVKISQLSLATKVVSSQETQKERELASNKEQAKEKWKELEGKYDETLKTLEKVRAERMEVENKNKGLLEELLATEKLKNDKRVMLHNYLMEQKELFSRYSKAIEDTESLSEECGEVIYAAMQKHLP